MIPHTTMAQADAVIKPLTLVEKLERELAANCRLNNWDLGLQAAINIVKQHNEWVRCDERLPPVAQPVLVYNYGNLRVLPLCKTDSGLKWLDEFGQDEFDLDEIDFWQPLPKPPSEVQDEQNHDN